MIGLTKSTAKELGSRNIRCNAIAPGGVYNNHDSDFVNNYSKYCPMGRMADKKEMTSTFVFLASDASSYIAGSVLVVDGGWTAW